MSTTKTIHLVKRPVGLPKPESDFAVVEETLPPVGEGEVLLKTLYISVDPYMRGRMDDAKSYAQCFALNEPISGGVVAEVVESKNSTLKTGDVVTGMLPWKERMVIKNVSDLKPLTWGNAFPHSYALGVLGMPGMTALLALEIIGQPKSGETLVVSGAAGAVGSIVGQLGKIFGMTVVGIAGGQEKIDYLKKLGFDSVIDYKTTTNMQAAIAEACPKGVDVYYDNVGGSISDAVSMNVNRFGRIILCGAISSYNLEKPELGPRDNFLLISRSIKKEGFIATQWADKWPAGIARMAAWLKEGKLRVDETVRDGFENAPKVFVEMLTGGNIGKMVVKA